MSSIEKKYTAEDDFVEVRIKVRGANGQDCDVTMKDYLRIGGHIPKIITDLADETAELAYESLTPRLREVIKDRTAS